MSDSFEGGPAFPAVTTEYNQHREKYEVTSAGGMTLRDYFAAKAMNGLLAAGRDAQFQMDCLESLAQSSYGIADAMLEAREA